MSGYAPTTWVDNTTPVDAARMNNVEAELVALAATGMKLISELGGSTLASFDFTSIPATYRALKLMVCARGDTAAATTNLNLTINGLGTGIYDASRLSGQAGASPAASVGETMGGTSITLSDIPAATAPAGVHNIMEILFPWYALASVNRVLLATVSWKYGTATGNIFNRITSGFVRDSTAISRITMTPAAGSLASTSRAALFGLN